MRPLRLKRYLLTGLLMFIPLWVTWLVFKFVLGMLAGIGAPLVNALVGALALIAPKAASIVGVIYNEKQRRQNVEEGFHESRQKSHSDCAARNGRCRTRD